MPSTFRTDIVTGIEAVLLGVQAAHPTLLLAVSRARPEGFPDLPAAYIDTRPERITHDSQIRSRIMTPTVVVVRRITDNVEAMVAFDVLVDILVDAFTAVPQFAAGTIWDELEVADEDAPYGDYDFAAVRFTFGNVSIQEGRV